ncbi:MAG TPA: MFS transporter [Verrucomicrobiales bacterium]|nr:MFS transporter [Verrucomicrobiales bacterium]
MKSEASPKAPLTMTQWLICTIASIGFAFDIYVLLMLPLIIKPALAALGGAGADGVPLLVPGSPDYIRWARVLFFVPAIAGGVFGLVGGYLTDRLGRRRVLTASIILYSASTLASGYATSLEQLLVMRCLVFIGVCVEFVAAVAWLAELFPDPERREKVLGYTQAFSSIGGLLVAGANGLAVEWAAGLPAIHGGHEAWRYTLMSGLIPAIPLLFIRPFLPESPVWQAKRAAGQLRRPSFGDLFTQELRRVTLTSTLIFAACYGLAFGAIQHLPQIVPGMADVRALVKSRQEELTRKAEADGKPKPTPKALAIAGKAVEEGAAAGVQKWQELGGLVGRFALALLALRIASRRNLLRIFFLPALVYVPLLFWWIGSNLGAEGNLGTVKWAVAAAGFLVVATFSFWGNYLPLVYPIHLRGTGESFAANIGGRVLGTSAAWFTFTLSAATPPSPSKIAMTAAAVAGVFALVGAILIQWLPEPKSGSSGE